MKDFIKIKKVQRRVTKFILKNSFKDYKLHLVELNLLSIMHWFELQDILFLLKCLKFPPEKCDIEEFVTFFHGNACESTHTKIVTNQV